MSGEKSEASFQQTPTKTGVIGEFVYTDYALKTVFQLQGYVGNKYISKGLSTIKMIARIGYLIIRKTGF